MPAELTLAGRDQLDQRGAIRFGNALGPSDLGRLLDWCEGMDNGRPGERIRKLKALGWLLDEGIVGAIARGVIGPQARPVRAILFDKSPASNWALGWHQDRTIAVDERVEVSGFGNWNLKAGVHHVEPPFDFVERMITSRIHLDDVDQDNAPLLIVPGSHLLGRIVETDIERAVEELGEMACLAEAGDVWLYRTAILHASKRARGNNRRRVLQVNFSADELPAPLRWAA